MNKENLKNLVKNVDCRLSELLSNVVCSICHELFTKPVTTPCGHSFCNTCIKRVLSSKGNNGCPLCKNPIKRYALEEDKVKLTLSKICQELPAAFAEDVKELTADLKDFGEDLLKNSKLSQFKQESPKQIQSKTRIRKCNKVIHTRINQAQESDSGSFTPVLKRSKNRQEYASAKRRRTDDLVSISQTEPTSSSSVEPIELDKKLQKIEKIPPEEKVKEWFNSVGDNIYINSPVSECDKKEIDRPASVGMNFTEEDHKTDPYEFVPSQNVRKKFKRNCKKTTKKIPHYQALQSFNKESVKRIKLAQEKIEKMKERRASPVEKNNITASQKFDQLLSETKVKPHTLYSASLSSSPDFLNVSLNSKRDEKEPLSDNLDDIFFKEVEILKNTRKKRTAPVKKSKQPTEENKKQTRLGELLQELVNDDIIYGTQHAGAPVKLQNTADEQSSKIEGSPISNVAFQKSGLVGFDVQEESLDEMMFKQMVENMERELNFAVQKEDIKKPKDGSFVAFNLLGKIRQSKPMFVDFLQLGRLTPTRTRTRSTVVKVVFPIGLASLAKPCRRTVKREISSGVQAAQRMVSSTVQTSQEVRPSKEIQTSQKFTTSTEIQTSQKVTTSTEIQTTQRQKSCEVQTTQVGCSAQVQTTQRGQSCEVQTTQIGQFAEVQTTQVRTQNEVERITPRKPVHIHRKIISQVNNTNGLFSNDEEPDLMIEFEKTWQKTQKAEEGNGDDSDGSDIQPLKRTTRVLSSESITAVEVIEKPETPQKTPLSVQKLSQNEGNMEVMELGTPMKLGASQTCEEQMLRVLKNINLDLTKGKKDDAKGENSEESDSDFFVEQTPPKTQRAMEHSSKAKENNTESADLIGDSLPKGFSESFLMLTLPEKPDENDQNQINANREAETRAAVEPRKRAEPEMGKKICVVASSIKNPEMIRKFAARFKLEYLSKPSKEMTHLIVGLHKSEENEELPLCTPKLLFAMANKKWVVSEQWAEFCLKMNMLLPEESFETLDPVGGCGCQKARLSNEKLLKNCEIYLLGNFQTMSKEEFADLILDCGGTVVPSPEKFSFLPSRLRMIVADRECLNMNDAEIKGLFEKHSTVVLSRDVIIMSIQSYTLANLSSYLLHFASEKTLIRLGYPPSLVKSEEDEVENEWLESGTI